MPGARIYPSSGYPLSRAELRKVMGFNPLYDFLDNYARRNVVRFEDDFLKKAIDTTNDYTVAAGSTATTWAINTQEDGVVRGVWGGTAATSGLQLSNPAVFLSPRNIGVEVLFTMSNVTAKRVEIGFVNALPSVNTAIVNSLTTPTFNSVTDGCVYVFDNTSSVNTSGLYTISSVSSGQANIGAAVGGLSPTLPTTSTWVDVRVEVKNQSAFLWVNGVLVAKQAYDGATATTSAVNPATALVPVFMSSVSGDTNTGNLDIDFVVTVKDRLH